MELLELKEITLRRGMHTHRDKGMCLNEAVAWYVGESHTDSPQCMSRCTGKVVIE